MKKYYLNPYAIVLVLFMVNTSIMFAQTPTTVRWVNNHQEAIRADGRWVVLHGMVTVKLNADSYEFNDGTGTIRLDSNIRLPVGQPIVLTGKIDEAFMGIGPLEIDVRKWHPDTIAQNPPGTIQQAPPTVYSQPAPVAAPSLRYGTIVNGSVKSPYSDFTISLSGLAQGSKVFDANSGQPLLVP